MADLSDPQGSFNPYAPPVAPDVPPMAAFGDDEEMFLPAERATRWWARLIDSILIVVTCIPAGIAWAGGNVGSSADLHGLLRPVVVGLFLIPFALCCYQWMLLSTVGQTLGKKVLHIKVIRMDGSPVGFVHGVLLREWLLTVAGGIPYVGNVVGLVDVLMIFGEERRCLHDRIAGTRVVLTLRER